MKRNLLIALVALISVAWASGADARSYGSISHGSISYGSIRVSDSGQVWDVWVGGRYAGRDPDTNVRATLVRHSWFN